MSQPAWGSEVQMTRLNLEDLPRLDTSRDLHLYLPAIGGADDDLRAWKNLGQKATMRNQTIPELEITFRNPTIWRGKPWSGRFFP